MGKKGSKVAHSRPTYRDRLTNGGGDFPPLQTGIPQHLPIGVHIRSLVCRHVGRHTSALPSPHCNWTYCCSRGAEQASHVWGTGSGWRGAVLDDPEGGNR